MEYTITCGNIIRTGVGTLDDISNIAMELAKSNENVEIQILKEDVINMANDPTMNVSKKDILDSLTIEEVAERLHVLTKNRDLRRRKDDIAAELYREYSAPETTLKDLHDAVDSIESDALLFSIQCLIDSNHNLRRRLHEKCNSEE